MNLARAAIILCALGLLALPARPAPPPDLDARRAEIARWRIDQLGKLARDAEAQGAVVLARRIFVLAQLAGAPDAAEAFAQLADADDGPRLSRRKRAGIEKKLAKHRAEAAKKLGDLAKAMAADGRTDAAAAVARSAIREDPSNAVGRRVLGQDFVPGWGWVEVEAARKMKRGRYEFEGRWLPRKEVERRRREWKHAWSIESDHFLLRSNLDLDRSLELRDILEAFHACWTADWEDLLPLRETTEKHRILVFARQPEYEAHCAAEDPRFVRGVPGQYSFNLRRAAFYDVEVLRAQGQNTSSLVELMLHECTHQLFREVVDGPPANVDIGDTPNYWIHEGIAEFYGSHTFAKGRVSMDRKALAKMLRSSWLKERAALMPKVAELGALRKTAFQSPDQTTRRVHYAQSGFFCLYLMESEHRGAFRRLVREMYCGKNEPGLLEGRLGTDLASLDTAFRRYVKAFPGR